MNESPMLVLEYLLLNTLSNVYKQKTPKEDWGRYSDLLIDKYAIHASSLYHLMQGVIEHKNSTKEIRLAGYDLFSINALLRVLMETYCTYHHVFISPKSFEERELKFLLWKLDGLIEKGKLKNAKYIFDKDEEVIQSTIQLIESSAFLNNLELTDRLKIWDTKKRANWKFKIKQDNKIQPLKIIELIEYTLPSQLFKDTYIYASTHSHSGYPSIEHFENIRGKEVSDSYTNSIVELVIFLTTFLIRDICETNEASNQVFLYLPSPIKEFINQSNRDFLKR